MQEPEPILAAVQLRYSQQSPEGKVNPITTSTRIEGTFRSNGPLTVYTVGNEIIGTVVKEADSRWKWARLESARLPDWDAPKQGAVESKVEALLLSSGEKLAKTEVPESDEHRQILLGPRRVLSDVPSG